MQDLASKPNLAEQPLSDAKTPHKSPGNVGATTRGKPQTFVGFSGSIQQETDVQIAKVTNKQVDTQTNSGILSKKRLQLQASIKTLSLGISAKVKRAQKEMIPILRSRICRSFDEIDLSEQKTVFLSFNKGASVEKQGLTNNHLRDTSLPKLDHVHSGTESAQRTRVRFHDRQNSLGDQNNTSTSLRGKGHSSLNIVTKVLEDNKHNKSSLEASVESYGRSVLSQYQKALLVLEKRDKTLESKIREAPGLFVAIKKKIEAPSKEKSVGPKVTFQLTGDMKRGGGDRKGSPRHISNPNDYRSPENQTLLRTIFQSPDNLFKKLQKLKPVSGSKDGRDRTMEKHESNQRIMTRIFTSEPFHSVSSEITQALMTFKVLTTDKDIWRPQTRERATLTRVGKNLALFGGLSNSVDPYIHFFDLKRRTWIEEEKFGEEKWGADQKCYKADHSACFYSPYLIYFGGEVHDHHGDQSVLSNDVIWYSIEKDLWDQSLRTKISAQELPERKNHIAFVHNSDMYVLGGHTGIYTQHHTDCYKLNLKSLVWTRVTVISIEHLFSRVGLTQ